MERVGLADNNNNGSKRRVLRHLDHRYVFFIFISCFTYLNQYFLFYLGSINVLKRRGGLGWPAMQKMDPNNVSCVVWALGLFFFFLCAL